MPPYLSFETLSGHYSYDTDLPLHPKLSQAHEFTLRGTDGLPVYGDVFVPDVSGPWPLMIGPNMLIGNDLPKHGVLTAWLDYRLTGRDKKEGLQTSYAQSPGMLLWARIQTILDFRRLLDWLLDEYDIDTERICFCGASKGAMMGVILGAVEARFKQFILRAGGADMALYAEKSQDPRLAELRSQPWYSPEFWGTLMAPYDCQYFVHRLSPRPVLFQFGQKDNVIPTDCFHKMTELSGEPKTVMWYDAGHGLRAAGITPMIDARKWLAEIWNMPQIISDDPANWPETPAY